jgi:7,8-dihydropterin-6-yl-methyl-4-(beta-D-ribofuranosyl)aminobenzene 5'-phosphate synthase
MIKDLCVTILADNSVGAPVLEAEHGLSMLVEADGQRILFDTGQGGVLQPNARTLGCSLDSLDAIVLSHGHYDHTGGLAQVIPLNGRARLFLHPAALDPKYACSQGRPARSIGIPAASLEAVEAARKRVVWTQSSTEVTPGVWCTGEIPRLAPVGADNSRFFLDEDCRRPDPLADDQALVVETAGGIVVLAGCTHAGVVNTLDSVERLTGTNRVSAIAGGLHLTGVPPAVWDAAGDALGRRGVRLIVPCHCTGAGAWHHLSARFGDRVRDAGAGSRFAFQ